MSNNKSGKDLKTLERLYNTATKKEKILPFLKSLNAYVKFTFENPVFRKIVEEQMSKRNTRYKNIERAEKKL